MPSPFKWISPLGCIALSFFLLETSAVAAPASDVPSLFQGLNINLSAGLNSTLIQSKQDVTQTVNAIHSTVNTPIHTSGATADLGIGYAWVMRHRFYLGVNAFLRLNNRVANVTAYPLDDSFANRDNVPSMISSTQVKFSPLGGGIDLSPGLQLSPSTLLFGTVGLDLQSANVTSTMLNQNPSTHQFLARTSASKHAFLNGLRLGLGVSSFITSSLALKFSYLYTNYGSETLSATNPAYGDENLQSHIKLADNSLMLGVAYYFNHQGDRKRLLEQSRGHWNGFFAGFGIGALNNLYKNGTNTLYRTRLGTIYGGNRMSGSTFGRSSAQYALSAGFGHLFHRFYLGTALSVSAANRKGENSSFAQRGNGVGNLTNDSVYTNIKGDTPNYNLDIRSGFTLNQNTLLYLTGGVSLAKFALNVNQNFVFNGYPELSLTNYNTSQSSTRLGLRFGLGMQEMLGHGYALSFDYNVSNFGHMHMTSTTQSPNGQRTFTSDASVSLRNQSATVGIVKYFS